jgi:tetratricopeptide (TPR) repeat protein
MFTFNIYLRFFFLIALLPVAIYLSFEFGFWYSFPFYLFWVIFLVGYIMLGTVQSAAKLMEKMDFLGAEKRLKLTLSPKLLFKTNRAYFYLLRGTIALNLKENDIAEQFLLKAKETGLSTGNEKAMVHLQLANLAAGKNNWNGALMHFRAAKKFKVTDPNLREQMRQYEKALANRGVLKSAGMSGQGMQMAGGKRRRPKMR